MEYNLEVIVKATRTMRGSQTQEVQTYTINKQNIQEDQLEDIRQHLEQQLVIKDI